MSTIAFIAGHNAVSPEAEEHRKKAVRFYQAHMLAVQNFNDASNPIEREWYGARAEWYAEKSDDSFAAALSAARGL
jgi:hypothetical protein